MKKLVICMTNGKKIISDNDSFEDLANVIDSNPNFLAMRRKGSKFLVNVKQIAYAKEVEE